MTWSEEEYDKFVAKLEGKYPEMFSQPYGGVAVGQGWWEIIEFLCGHIDSYIKWKNKTYENTFKGNRVEQVVVMQIKEKFGGLRFYYEGGDDYVRGLVTMAESWAANTCEECGQHGQHRSGGWIRTLCDVHEAERQERLKERI